MNIKRAIKKEMKRARELHPDWPKDQIYQAAIIVEEAGEILQAANNHVFYGASIGFTQIEVIQTIVTCIRYLEANK